MEYKEPELQEQFEKQTEPLLRKLVQFIDNYSVAHFGHGILITSVTRSGDPFSLHCTRPVRAADFRSHTYTDEQIESMLQDVNDEWNYNPLDPAHKCLICHDVGQGKHFHSQVHPNTVIR